MLSDNSNFSVKRLATVKQVSELYPAFSQSSLRWLIFNEQQNNFYQVVRRIGRRILINLDDFESWIDAKTSSPKF